MSSATDMKPSSGELGLPLEADVSGVQFVLFGELHRKKTIYFKSKDAPLELLGSYPLEAIEVSPGDGFFSYPLQVMIDVLYEPYHWVMSLPVTPNPETTASARLVLVWSGLANEADRGQIKETLDRNALDITTAAQNGDRWATILSAGPVIAHCGRVDKKGKLARTIGWLFMLILALIAIGIVCSRG